MKTSFHGNRILFVSAVAGLAVGVFGIVSTSCGKHSAEIKRWNAKYEYERERLDSLNERQINAVY